MKTNDFQSYSVDSKDFLFTRGVHTFDINLSAFSNAYLYVKKTVEERYVNVNKINFHEDEYGVLPIVLGKRCNIYNDSCLNDITVDMNCNKNEFKDYNLNSPFDQISDKADLTIVSTVKSLSYFEYLVIKSIIDSGRIIAYGSDKNLTIAYTNILKKYYNKVEILPSWKKSRILTGEAPIKTELDLNILISTYSGRGIILKNYPGSYAYNSPDPGALSLLNGISSLDDFGNVLDMGCGNGILTKYLFIENKNFSNVTLTDINHSSILSAKLNLLDFEHRIITLREDSRTQSQETYDTILLNPPFHSGRGTTRLMALELFNAAHKKLNPDGRMFVVYNRHLNYYYNLKRLFHEVDILIDNNKFTVLVCKK
ncbi:MAG: methyltransferase [Candidatus Delongbacteria bacterium]|nr:methyltransferase [Candidatus Delongbacteria bacterium]MBN2834461.1 methyltransferase [Candidatus Delongbacteria bacterium]